jgi:hypothetical protein
LNKDNLVAGVLSSPSKEDIESNADLQMIVEYYSR